MRDYRKLKAFELADALVVDVYRFTAVLLPEERFGLMSQLRRAAVSVPTNIVEGSARNTLTEYLRFITIASASAQETLYLLSLCQRLPVLVPNAGYDPGLLSRADELCRVLTGLIRSLEDSR